MATEGQTSRHGPKTPFKQILKIFTPKNEQCNVQEGVPKRFGQ